MVKGQNISLAFAFFFRRFCFVYYCYIDYSYKPRQLLVRTNISLGITSSNGHVLHELFT